MPAAPLAKVLVTLELQLFCQTDVCNHSTRTASEEEPSINTDYNKLPSLTDILNTLPDLRAT